MDKQTHLFGLVIDGRERGLRRNNLETIKYTFELTITMLCESFNIVKFLQKKSK